jgi:hypothetical protein
MMHSYWFTKWMDERKVRDEESLRAALSKPRGLDILLEAAPEARFRVRSEAPRDAELTGGKGIDFSGRLGCHNIDCLRKEIDTLYRNIWHYFDRVTVPDEALYSVTTFEREKDVEQLVHRLAPFVQALRYIRKTGGASLIEVEVRAPSCREHLSEHAEEAGIAQALPNVTALARKIASTADTSWHVVEHGDHRHVEFRLVHDAFEHTEWGSLCEQSDPVPPGEPGLRQAIAEDVVCRYLAELSADALAASRARAPLGAAIPFYRRLLAQPASPEVGDVAFELALPISTGLPTDVLLKVRRDEAPAFQRFQAAIKIAISERLTSATSANAAALAEEIRLDIIEPELRRIRDLLATATTMTNKSGLTGVALGATAATIGLLYGGPMGAGLAVAGAATLGMASLKKAKDDLLAVRREVALSEMYFLWKAHKHRARSRR